MNFKSQLQLINQTPKHLEVPSTSANTTTGFPTYRFIQQRDLKIVVLAGLLGVIQSNPIILWVRTLRPRDRKGPAQGHTRRQGWKWAQKEGPRTPVAEPLPPTSSHLPLAHSALADPHPGKPGKLRLQWCCGSHTGPLRQWVWAAPRPCSVTLESDITSRPSFAPL